MQPLMPINETLHIDGFHNIYYFEFDKHHTHPLEKHDFWEMVYVDMGEIIAITETKSMHLKGEQVIFRAPGEMHAHHSDMRSANNLLVISFSSRSPAMAFFETNRVFTLDKTAKTVLSLFVREAKNALGAIPARFEDHSALNFSKESFGASQLMHLHFTEFLLKLIRNTQSPKENCDPLRLDNGINKIERIITYMHEHIYEPLSLDALCNRFFVRKSQLSTLFKEYTGQSPIHYFASLKINEAKKLLRNNELTVSQIAYALGFSDIYTFSRAFKKTTGFSPTAYKKGIG